jgi:tRNA(Ile)-lysidine synthase
MTHEAQLPIALSEAKDAFARIAAFDHAILAVSGGPDSMALLVLAAECFARSGKGAPLLSVATIDHGLRAESAAEAEFVASEARRLGLSHTTLRWTGEKPATGIAAAARSARYRLLEEYARSFPTERVAVVTAHHLDDQAETFTMRLARGAGVAGLAAMAAERPLAEGSPIRLVRPFLTFSKSRLIATVEARGVRFFNDPTNEDGRYERARVRQLLPALDAAGITSAALATSARRLGEAEAALRYAESRFIATLDLSFGNDVFASLKTAAFREGPSLLRQRVLAHLIVRYGGASQKPQLSEIEDLAARLQSEGKRAATLGGAMISSGGRFIRVWREAGRLTQAEFDLSPGESRTWDDRFIVSRTPDARGPVRIKPLGSVDYLKIASRLARGRRPPARATHALPSFWRGGDLIAVPSLAPFSLASGPSVEESGCRLKILALSSSY